MGLVAAKCPQCGANINVDEEKDAGICEYCGTAFITEKAINNYNTYVTNNYAGANINITGGNMDNLLKMAENATEATNGSEALNYVNKALEIEPESSRAWILKMKTVKLQDDLHNNQLDTFNINVQETVTYGNKAIEYALPDEKEKVQHDVYTYYLQMMDTYVGIAENKVDDTRQLVTMRKKMSDNQGALNELLNLDLQMMDSLTNKLIVPSSQFRFSIPDEYVQSHDDIQDIILEITRLYIKYCNEKNYRIQIHKRRFTNDILRAQEDDVQKMLRGLSESRKQQIDFSNAADIEKNNKKQSSGCYIATCVYGSYDCPEVWTLRRFRDYTLDVTWYGRVFIKCYYTVSPSLVKWFGNRKWFKNFWRNNLDKMVTKLKENGIKDTFYQDKY